MAEHEFEIEFDVAELLIGDQIDRASLRTVQDALARALDAAEAGGAEQAIPGNRRGREPLVGSFTHAVPAGKIAAVEQGSPAVLDEERRIAVGVTVIQLRTALAGKTDCRGQEQRQGTHRNTSVAYGAPGTS